MDNVVVSMREVVGRVTSNDIDPGDIIESVEGEELTVRFYDNTYVHTDDEHGRSVVLWWHEIDRVVEKGRG